MRIGAGARLGLGYVHPAQHFDGLAGGFPRRQSAMQCYCLGDLSPDRQERVQRGHRLLKDHRDLVAADRLHFALGEIEEVAALKADGTADDPSRRVGDEAQN